MKGNYLGDVVVKQDAVCCGSLLRMECVDGFETGVSLSFLIEGHFDIVCILVLYLWLTNLLTVSKSQAFQHDFLQSCYQHGTFVCIY